VHVCTLGSWSRAALVIAAAVLVSRLALANGNYSHVWVATDALTYLPAGELRDLFQDEHLVNIVRNGAMYPDGGYAMNDGYGEISHWEPFHLAYLDWIRTTYAAPWSDEALEHVAFLFGMVAHGLTDQLYDGMYLERSEVFDQGGCDATPYGTDGSTDACFAATQGPLEKPVAWVPADVLAPLYETQGHIVSAQTLKQGHNLVFFAIVHANVEGANPEIIADYMAKCPWACGHQNDPASPGSPVTNGPAIAAYWQGLWARLNGDEGFGQPLLDTYMTGGTSWEVPRDASSPDSWVSFAMPRGLEPSTVTPATVVVTRDADGSVHPVTVNVYYGESSHLVNVKPQEDWAEDSSYTVTVSPPIASWDGAVMEAPRSFTFSTLPAPAQPEPEPVEVVEVSEVVEAVDGSEPTPEVIEAVEPPPDVPVVADVRSDVTSDGTPDTIPAADVVADTASPDEGGGGGGCALPRRAGDSSAAAWVLLLVTMGLIAVNRRGVRRCE